MSSKTQPSNEKIYTCSFCGKKSDSDSDRVFIWQDDAVICSDCISICIKATTEQLATKLNEAESRVTELETRLELTPESHGHDGIYARDETIRLQDKQIEELEGVVSKVGAYVDGCTKMHCMPTVHQLKAILKQVKD